MSLLGKPKTNHEFIRRKMGNINDMRDQMLQLVKTPITQLGQNFNQFGIIDTLSPNLPLNMVHPMLPSSLVLIHSLLHVFR